MDEDGSNSVTAARIGHMENSEELQRFERPYRVLSLDGGGMRGIYTAAFLARLTDQFARIRNEGRLISAWDSI